MKANFSGHIPTEKITEEKITAILSKWADETINGRHKAFGIYRETLVHECKKLAKPFLELIKFDIEENEKPDFNNIEKRFLKKYQNFTDTFRQTLQSNRAHFYLFCYISVGVTEVISYFLKEACTYGDLVASHLALQLQADINRIVDEEFENKKLHT